MSENNTEQKILEAARKVFTTKGLDGARMQDIADTAGINKALLHYYFRSKDKLFQKVFYEKGNEMALFLQEIVNKKLPVREKLMMLIDKHYERLEQESIMALFLITEVNRNADKLFDKPEKEASRVHMRTLLKQIEEEKAAGTINQSVEAESVLVDVMSMLGYPLLARPLYVEMLFDGDKERFEKFIMQRKKHVKDLILKSLEP